ncbi:MAG TPA: Fur family transcriptional regulator [Ktedonobacterales bacterium]
MKITAATILTVFEDMGLRSTRPRRLIADHLATLAGHGADFATDELWHDLQAADPHIGRATVFRAVDVLVERGVLARITFPDGSHCYRVCGPQAHHHHATCVRCRRVIEVSACLPQDMLRAIERATNFAVEGHSVELFGRCEDCRVADADPGKAL